MGCGANRRLLISLTWMGVSSIFMALRACRFHGICFIGRHLTGLLPVGPTKVGPAGKLLEKRSLPYREVVRLAERHQLHVYVGMPTAAHLRQTRQAVDLGFGVPLRAL